MHQSLDVNMADVNESPDNVRRILPVLHDWNYSAPQGTEVELFRKGIPMSSLRSNSGLQSGILLAVSQLTPEEKPKIRQVM